MHFVYVLKNQSDNYYLGNTNNIERRLQEHNNGEEKSTRGSKWELVYYEAYLNKKYAVGREKKLKKNRRMKQLLLTRIKESLE